MDILFTIFVFIIIIKTNSDITFHLFKYINRSEIEEIVTITYKLEKNLNLF